MDKGDQMDDGRTRWTGSCGQRRCTAAVPMRRGHGCDGARHGGQSGALVPGGWCSATGKGAGIRAPSSGGVLLNTSITLESTVWRVYTVLTAFLVKYKHSSKVFQYTSIQYMCCVVLDVFYAL